MEACAGVRVRRELCERVRRERDHPTAARREISARGNAAGPRCAAGERAHSLPMKAAIAAAGLSLLVVHQAPQAPLFRTTTRMISVFATVQGTDGRLIPNLSKQDF